VEEQAVDESKHQLRSFSGHVPRQELSVGREPSRDERRDSRKMAGVEEHLEAGSVLPGRGSVRTCCEGDERGDDGVEVVMRCSMSPK
jgi:hypothetical protein